MYYIIRQTSDGIYVSYLTKDKKALDKKYEEELLTEDPEEGIYIYKGYCKESKNDKRS